MISSLVTIPDTLQDLLQFVCSDGPVFSLGDGEQILMLLADAARSQDARDNIIASNCNIDRNVFWENSKS